MSVAPVITMREVAVIVSVALALTACHKDDPCGAASKECKGEGRCTPGPGRCAATSDEACAASDICAEEGRCSAREGRCTVVSREQCEKSRACRDAGRCTPDDGFCAVKSRADCARLPQCAYGRCKVEEGTCKVDPYDPNNKEGGCPCGCDHSEEMASELAAAPSVTARATINETLRVIAEREDAGYITPAMVTHRRRLLALSAQIGNDDAVIGRGAAVPGKARLGVAAVSSRGDGLGAHAELWVHGETTEQVRGADKTIRASFVLALELENASRERQVLSPPKLEGDAGFPVSSWYVLGGDGSPWDGVLEAGETRRVNAIGYLDQPLAPGHVAVAQVKLAGLSFKVTSLARAHWR